MTLEETARGDDPRLEAARRTGTPVWLVRGDGVVWCNAAGAAALGWRATSGPLPRKAAAAVARIAGGLPLGGARLAMLRIGTGGAFAGTPCRCSRFALPDGGRAVLVEALSASPGPRPQVADAPAAVATRPADARAMPVAFARAEASGGAVALAAPDSLPPIETVDIVEPVLLLEPVPLLEPDVALPSAPTSGPTVVEDEGGGEDEGVPADGAEAPIRFVFETDADARITFLSPEAVTAIGQTAARLFARPWNEAAEELGLDPEGKVEAALGRRDTWSGVTIDWIFADGRRRPVALSALPMFDQDRKFRGYRGFGVCRPEVAAAPPAPAAAPSPPEIEARAELLTAAEAATDSKVIDFEARTGVRGAREAAAERSGLSAAERTAFREIGRALGTRGALAEEVLAEAVPLVEPAEEPAERHPLPEELAALLELSGDPALIVDEQGAIARFGAAVPGFFGRRAGDLRGLRFTALLAPESEVVALDYFEGVRSGGGAARSEGLEVAGARRDGATVPLSMRIGRVPRSELFAIVLRDLSPWRKAEEELLSAKQRSDRASSHKSDFLAKISHEIRTPLNAIIGFSEVMSEERFGPVGNPRYREYLRDIRASGEHLVSLVNDLLDLSKIEAGKLDLNFTSVDLNEIVQGCVAIMQPQSHARQIVIRTSLSRTLPPVVADERSVRQIVLNLLSNAVKFTEPGGQVIVATALTDLGQAVIRVRDTGLGMSARDIETALEPFRQLVTATAGGTGLGLPLTKALVEANKATFAIESEVGEGTLVEVIFPPTRVLGE